jgi:hypothetical protein
VAAPPTTGGGILPTQFSQWSNNNNNFLDETLDSMFNNNKLPLSFQFQTPAQQQQQPQPAPSPAKATSPYYTAPRLQGLPSKRAYESSSNNTNNNSNKTNNTKQAQLPSHYMQRTSSTQPAESNKVASTPSRYQRPSFTNYYNGEQSTSTTQVLQGKDAPTEDENIPQVVLNFQP